MFQDSSHALRSWVNILHAMIVLTDISILIGFLFVNFPLKLEHHSQHSRDPRLVHGTVVLLTGDFIYESHLS